MVSTPELGSLIGDKYRIVRPLGVGGMGAVYEAEHLVTGKRCAVKWLHPQPGARATDRQRVIHEARAACRIHHENVVDVYDVIEQEGAISLVMELLTGEPLSALLAREPPPPGALIALLLPAMRGLIAVHEAGVVHRDVKPQNIFLANEPGHRAPVPKIIDFGISTMRDAEAQGAHPAGVTGTPRYMSYEQLLGASDVDARTDVYALGVILYEALTGAPPYGDAQSLGDLAVRFATTTPAPPHALRPALPEALSAVVMRAIARDRDARLPSVAALIEALAPFAETAPRDDAESRATVRPRPPRRSLPSRARWTRPSLAALGAVAALAAVAMLRGAKERGPVAPAPPAAAAAAAALPVPRPPLASPPSAGAPAAAPDPPAAAASSGAERDPATPGDAALPAVRDDAAPRATPTPRAARRRVMHPAGRALAGAAAASAAAGDDAGVAAPADERHRAGALRRHEF